MIVRKSTASEQRRVFKKIRSQIVIKFEHEYGYRPSNRALSEVLLSASTEWIASVDRLRGLWMRDCYDDSWRSLSEKTRRRLSEIQSVR